MLEGMDVSKWQGNIAWQEVSPDTIKFVMIRSSFGTEGVDEKFKRNVEGAKNSGIPAGAYHYCYAQTTEQALEEARHCLAVIKGSRLTYPIALDMEDPSLASLDRSTLTDICIVFLEEIQKAGYFPMLYANENWVTTKLEMSRLAQYDLWLAQYGVEAFTYEGEVGIWQYSDEGNVNGISGYVDKDKSYKDYATIIQDGHFNHLEEDEDMDNITLEEAKKIIQEKCGFDDNTMLYLSFYRYAESMLIRMAKAME